MTTILGWFFIKIPLGLNTAFMLNILAALTSAFMAALIFMIAGYHKRLSLNGPEGTTSSSKNIFFALGAAIGVLSFSFGPTAWGYSLKFTPYIFSACLTAAIMFVILKWWERADRQSGDKWLFYVLFLIGLDFSVHRTNLLLLLAVPFVILLRRGRSFILLKSWLSGFGGFVAGLAFHLLLIPMAASGPFWNAGDPSNLARFWDYISLKQYGGDWLINIFPRKASFFGVQLTDYLRTFGANFFQANGAFGILGILPTFLGLWGFYISWRKNWRIGLALTLLFGAVSFGAVVYFNLPANYFRPIDRHYLPSFVIFAFLAAFGLGHLLARMDRLFSSVAIKVTLLIAAAMIPTNQIISNYSTLDGSHKFFAYDFIRNMIGALPEKAILLTNGDTDTFPPWYLQAVEKFRPDVTLANISLLNTTWFVKQLVEKDPTLPLDLAKIGRIEIRPWKDSTVAMPLKFADPADNSVLDTTLPDSLFFHVPPSQYGPFLLPQDWLLLDIIKNNNWRRPICVTVAVPDQNIVWLLPYLRYEGLTRRLMPVMSPAIDTGILQENLFRKYVYRGYNDPDIYLEDYSRQMAINMFAAFTQLAYAQSKNGDNQGCRETMDHLTKVLPLDRLQPLPAELKTAYEEIRQNL